jgi:hypothetical protein
MLLLEDLYAQKRARVPDWRVINLQQHSHPHPQDQVHIAGVSPSIDRYERSSSVKRSSIFSRRRSTATNSSTDTYRRSSSVAGGSRHSSLVDMAATDNDSFKNKFLLGLSNVRKSGGRKSDPLYNSSEHEGDALRAHLKAMSESEYLKITTNTTMC